MLTLTIKGNKLVALRAANKRGIHNHKVHSQRINANGLGETTIRIDDVYEALTVVWFAEDSEIIHGVGYPDGTLLLYTHSKVD